MLKVRRFAGGQLFGRNTLGDPVLLVLFPSLDASFFLRWGCWILPKVFSLSLLRGVNHPRNSKVNKPAEVLIR
jgi:hypothetical protein